MISKENQQEVRFIIVILHQSKLLVLNEPFLGFDLVNVELLKEAFRELAAKKRTIIFLDDRMEHIEELYKFSVLLLSFAPAIMDKHKSTDKRQITVFEANGKASSHLEKSLQYKLPNGKREFPFEAVNADASGRSARKKGL